MVDASKYRITVQRRETEDGLLFEGTVHELPDVAVYGDSFDEAYELAVDAIEGLYELATQQGRSFPQPSKRETGYSGKFVARMPKWLHRDLAVAAADDGASLNSYVVSVLSAHKSRGIAATPERAEPQTQMLAGTVVVSSGSVVNISRLDIPLWDSDLPISPWVVPTAEAEAGAVVSIFNPPVRRASDAA